MKQPKTVPQAMRLPELSSGSGGRATISAAVELSDEGVEGDTICGFLDKDNVYKVVEPFKIKPDGPTIWVKRRL